LRGLRGHFHRFVDERLREIALLSALAVSSCGASPGERAPSDPLRAAPGRGEFPEEPRALLRYHSSRFKLSLPLPDGHLWKIDDHKNAALVALHLPTRSTLTLQSFTEPEVMNRQKCEARASAMGLLALRDPRTVEDLAIAVPEGYDSRIWVALETGSSSGSFSGAPLSGHVFLFGAFVHKCLFVHYATDVSSERDEALLTSRLAVARLRIVGGIEMEPFDEPPKIRTPGQ
jgi:hypothetical protein